MNVHEKLMQVQSKLKAPKGQFNSFGKYKYRSCEDILESLKPVLAEVKAVVTLKDTVVNIVDRFYIQATATFINAEDGEKIEVTSFAREDENKKGMDLAQVTGSVSSYARKYALNGLFCIDDTKDDDFTNTYDKDEEKKKKGALSEKQIERLFVIAKQAGYEIQDVKMHMVKKYKVTTMEQLSKAQYDEMCKGYEKIKK